MYWATEQDLHFWIIVAQYHNYFAPLLAEINFERVPGWAVGAAFACVNTISEALLV